MANVKGLIIISIVKKIFLIYYFFYKCKFLADVKGLKIDNVVLIKAEVVRECSPIKCVVFLQVANRQFITAINSR